MPGIKQQVLKYVARDNLTFEDNSNARAYEIKVTPPDGHVFYGGDSEVDLYYIRRPGLTKYNIWVELEGILMCGTMTKDAWDDYERILANLPP